MASEKLIIFLRHGHSMTNKLGIGSSAIEGYPLTELGERQATEASLKLAGASWIDNAYCSPVLRAVQTASIACSSLGLKPTIDFRITERGQGKREGMELLKDKEWTSDPKNEAESWESTKARMRSFMEDAKGRVILAVSHADPISAACDVVDGKGEAFHRATLPSNCHFSIIDFGNMKVIDKNADAIPESAISIAQRASNGM